MLRHIRVFQGYFESSRGLGSAQAKVDLWLRCDEAFNRSPEAVVGKGYPIRLAAPRCEVQEVFMTTYLAIDLGAKRSGMAWCTQAGLVEPLPTVDRGALEHELGKQVLVLEVDILVFGLPLRRGKLGEAARQCRRMAYALAKAVDRPLVFVDEAESTDEAKQRFPSLDKDAAAAALILSRFLADGPWEPSSGREG